jgi:SAM-dependent methyltransferase
MQTTLNHRACPACREPHAALLGEKNGFQICRCMNCCTLFSDRIPIDDEAENYDDYYTYSNLDVPDFVTIRLKEILNGFLPYRQTGRLLDIGFGAGSLLRTARELGWEAVGSEVSSSAVEHAIRNGLEVYNGTLQDCRFPEGHFDVVTASEILEHLPNPQSELREIKRILRPGGLFWGTTPSAQSLSFRILKLDWSVLAPPDHIQLYSAKGIWSMLREAGFERISLKTYGLNPYEIKRKYFPSSDALPDFARNTVAYELNEKLNRNSFRKVVKSALNSGLNILRMGDSIKIYAEAGK